MRLLIKQQPLWCIMTIQCVCFINEWISLWSMCTLWCLYRSPRWWRRWTRSRGLQEFPLRVVSYHADLTWLNTRRAQLCFHDGLNFSPPSVLRAASHRFRNNRQLLSVDRPTDCRSDLSHSICRLRSSFLFLSNKHSDAFTQVQSWRAHTR